MDHISFRFTVDSTWDEFLKDYYGVMGLPPQPGTNPGIPPMLVPHTIHLQTVIRQ
jgi:hypothetical protein